MAVGKRQPDNTIQIVHKHHLYLLQMFNNFFDVIAENFEVFISDIFGLPALSVLYVGKKAHLGSPRQPTVRQCVQKQHHFTFGISFDYKTDLQKMYRNFIPAYVPEKKRLKLKG